MDGNDNMTSASAQAAPAPHHDSFFEKLEHFPQHIIDALRDHSSVISLIVNSRPAQEIAAFEKTHGKEQIDAIKKAGVAAFTAAQTGGAHKSAALGTAVAAAFESGLAEVKSLGTLAMHMLLDAALSELGV